MAAFLGWRGADIVPLLIGYKAKMACSGAFVSMRPPEAVLADLERNDLAILKFIDTRIDPIRHAATASLLRLVSRQAVFRDGLGCALVVPGGDPLKLPAPLPLASPPAAAEAPFGAASALAPVLERAFEEPDPQRPRATRAVVIARGGRIVAERYADGISADTALAGWSMTKSVTNALVGILVGDGKLRVDAPAPVAEWAGDGRAAITLDHLLRMSSGLRVAEDFSPLHSGVLSMLFGAGDMSSFAVRSPLAARPGTVWQYSNATSCILARIIRTTLGDDGAYWTLPRRALFDPLGMGHAVIETDAAGTFVGSSYMYATAREWARFGALYLQDGVWEGRRILPEGWVSYSRSPAPADPTHGYGAHFWLAVPDEYSGADRTLPRDAFHAVGHEGQFVTILPKQDLVIVRLGRTRFAKVWDQPAFVRDVLAGLGIRW